MPERGLILALCRRLFPETMAAQVMLGCFLVLVFLLPVRVAMAIWPANAADGGQKIIAISLGATLFVAMKACYGYFGLRLAGVESGSGSKGGV